MEITIKGEPKEIAALVVALQERQEQISLIDKKEIISKTDASSRTQARKGAYMFSGNVRDPALLIALKHFARS